MKIVDPKAILKTFRVRANVRNMTDLDPQLSNLTNPYPPNIKMADPTNMYASRVDSAF